MYKSGARVQAAGPRWMSTACVSLHERGERARRISRHVYRSIDGKADQLDQRVSRVGETCKSHSSESKSVGDMAAYVAIIFPTSSTAEGALREG